MKCIRKIKKKRHCVWCLEELDISALVEEGRGLRIVGCVDGLEGGGAAEVGHEESGLVEGEAGAAVVGDGGEDLLEEWGKRGRGE